MPLTLPVVETRGFTTVLMIYVVNMMPLNQRIDTAQPFASPPVARIFIRSVTFNLTIL